MSLSWLVGQSTSQFNEIFLRKSFTIENLEQDINKLLELIEKLKVEKKQTQETITDLKNQLSEKEKDKND